MMKTIANLNVAFRGESNASHRYGVFAERAQAEGYAQVAKLFRVASKAEAIHRDAHQAAIVKLGGKPDEVKLDEVKTAATRENLAAAIKGEVYERDVMYPEFLKQAETDAAQPAIRTIQYALDSETEHARLYQEALEQLGKNKETPIFVCLICGYTTTDFPNKKCPACGAGSDKFMKF